MNNDSLTEDDIFVCENGSDVDLKLHVGRIRQEITRLQQAAAHNEQMAQNEKAKRIEMEHRAIAAETAHESANEMLVKAEMERDRYEDALERISNWAKAYPLDVFPEPDFKRVRELLEAGGVSLDSVSASNMRHVVEGVGKIADEALKGGEE